MRFYSFVLIFSLYSFSNYATSFRVQPEAAQIKNAEIICAGKMLAMNDYSRTSSLARLQILDCAKGSLRYQDPEKKEIDVRWPGARSGKVKTFVAGMETMQKDEIGIFYLKKDEASSHYFLDSWQIQKLRQDKNGELWIEGASAPSHSDPHSERRQVSSPNWSSFKSKVQQLENSSN